MERNTGIEAERVARLHSTSGGVSETELNELAVMPINAPDGARVVMTVTPVANWLSARRNETSSKLGGLARFIGRGIPANGPLDEATRWKKTVRRSCRNSANCPNFNCNRRDSGAGARRDKGVSVVRMVHVACMNPRKRGILRRSDAVKSVQVTAASGAFVLGTDVAASHSKERA
ncbi:hypothetical protein PSAB6_190056 [Paraburkholderia sabiae]|nr:hypothetical protein PSAB6_190056 [Paraburkholderia sabiae]